jgi:hypothetical protein
MTRNQFMAALAAALSAPLSCTVNTNDVGSLSTGGTVIDIRLQGGQGTGGAEPTSGGTVSTGGTVGGPDTTLLATCAPTNETLTVSRACSAASDCLALAESPDHRLSSGALLECKIGVFAINVAEEARLTAFFDGCQARPTGCRPEILTEDGKTAPIGTEVLASCEHGVCRSSLP